MRVPTFEVPDPTPGVKHHKKKPARLKQFSKDQARMFFFCSAAVFRNHEKEIPRSGLEYHTHIILIIFLGCFFFAWTCHSEFEWFCSLVVHQYNCGCQYLPFWRAQDASDAQWNDPSKSLQETIAFWEPGNPLPQIYGRKGQFSSSGCCNEKLVPKDWQPYNMEYLQVLEIKSVSHIYLGLSPFPVLVAKWRVFFGIPGPRA